MRIYIFFLMFFLPSLTLKSEYIWEEVKSVQLVQITGFAEDSSGNIYINKDNGGIYKSTDDGRNFQIIYNGVITEKVIIGLVCAGDKLFSGGNIFLMSTDKGDSFIVLDSTVTFYGDFCYYRDKLLFFKKYENIDKKEYFTTLYSTKIDTMNWHEELRIYTDTDPGNKLATWNIIYDKKGRLYFISGKLGIVVLDSLGAQPRTLFVAPGTLYPSLLLTDSDELYYNNGNGIYKYIESIGKWDTIIHDGNYYSDLKYRNGVFYFIIGFTVCASYDTLKTFEPLKEFPSSGLTPRVFITKKGTLISYKSLGYLYRGTLVTSKNDDKPIQNDSINSFSGFESFRQHLKKLGDAGKYLSLEFYNIAGGLVYKSSGIEEILQNGNELPKENVLFYLLKGKYFREYGKIIF